MFNPSHSLVNTHMSHLLVLYQPVIGTLVKFPNWHLFWSNSYFSISNLWATIKISISTQLSFKFLIFLFLFGTLAVKAMAFWEILLSSH